MAFTLRFVSLTANAFYRSTNVDVNRTSRVVTCQGQLTGSLVELREQKLTDQSIRLSFIENTAPEQRYENPKQIGEFGAPDVPWANVYLPPDAFALIWDAATASDGYGRSFSISFDEIYDGKAFPITSFSMSETIEPERMWDEEKNLYVARPRKHPVVTEIERARREMQAGWRRLTMIVYVAIGVCAVIGIWNWLTHR